MLNLKGEKFGCFAPAWALEHATQPYHWKVDTIGAKKIFTLEGGESMYVWMRGFKKVQERSVSSEQQMCTVS